MFSDRLEQEDLAFRQKMRKGYLEMVQNTPHAHLVDADKNINEIQAQVIELLKKHNITD